jgi:hypothetical protein
MIAKYFPEASHVHIWPVGGGWSGASLCRLFFDGEETEFYLKFFNEQKHYVREFSKHLEAQRWLGESTVALRPIPDLAWDAEAQSEAFPAEPGSSVYPICYASAASTEHPRETLKLLYTTKLVEFSGKAIARLLAILAQQPEPPQWHPEVPWTDPGGEHGFVRTREMLASLIATLDDLDVYGPAMCGSEKAWRDRRNKLEDLFYRPLPKWLSERCLVSIGCTHGDPNSRNCLVDPENPADLRLIDCGRYRPDGRRMEDLALIESDIKLTLLETDREAGKFKELDVGQLRRWCDADQEALRAGLDYTPRLADPTGKTSSSVRLAYRLVGLVREAAKQASGSNDTDGRHYFAALLYWTLKGLEQKTIRPGKMLLGLYSASEILRRFA